MRLRTVKRNAFRAQHNMNKQWHLTVNEEGTLSQLDATPSTSRKFEALAEYEKAKDAIWKITRLGMADKKEIVTYRAFLAEIGIRATAQAHKLLIIEDSTQK